MQKSIKNKSKCCKRSAINYIIYVWYKLKYKVILLVLLLVTYEKLKINLCLDLIDVGIFS